MFPGKAKSVFAATSGYLPVAADCGDLEKPSDVFVRCDSSSATNLNQVHAPHRSWISRALSFGGFSAELEMMVGSFVDHPEPHRVAPIFFAPERLDVLSQLVSRNPTAACIMMRRRADAMISPWKYLVRLVCGDGEALAYALDGIGMMSEKLHAPIAQSALGIARYLPFEGRILLHHLFPFVGNDERLDIIDAFVQDGRLDPKLRVGEIFVRVMRETSREERMRKVYPRILQTVLAGKVGNEAARGRLKALFHGWLMEDEGAKGYLERLA